MPLTIYRRRYIENFEFKTYNFVKQQCLFWTVHICQCHVLFGALLQPLYIGFRLTLVQFLYPKSS